VGSIISFIIKSALQHSWKRAFRFAYKWTTRA